MIISSFLPSPRYLIRRWRGWKLAVRPRRNEVRKAKEVSRRKRVKYFKLTQPPTVLIVDPDLGFVWWLGEILRNAGCEVVPALNCQQAITLTKELSLSLDLIFVDPTLAGVRSMIETLKAGQDRIKVVDVGSLGGD